MVTPGAPAPSPPSLSELMDLQDWSRTPLGPRHHWPLALRLASDLILASRFPMSVFWGEARTVLYNDGYATLLGGKHPEALGRPLQEVWPEIWGEIGPLVTRAMAGEPLWFEDLPLDVERGQGTERAWFTFSYAPIRDGTGAVRGILNTVTETTPRILAEAAMAGREAWLRTLADSIPQIAWSAGPDGQVNWFNQRWHDLTGIPRGDAPPSDADGARVLHPDDLAPARAAWAQAVAAGTPYEIEYRFLDRAAGGYRWHLVRALPVRDAQGRVSAWFGTATDIHDQREAREVLRRSGEELERLVASRTQELLRAEAALRHAETLQAMGQLTGSISHDFSNVLAVVEGGLHLLESPQLDEAGQTRVIAGIRESLDSARGLVRRLLAFARRQPLEPRPLDLNARVESMMELLRHAVGANVTLEAELSPDLPPVLLDAAGLEAALLNLVANARDAMPKGGRVVLSTGLEGAWPPSPWPTRARGWSPPCWPGCSSRSSPPSRRARARGSASRRCTASWGSRAATSGWRARRAGAAASPCCCPWRRRPGPDRAAIRG